MSRSFAFGALGALLGLAQAAGASAQQPTRDWVITPFSGRSAGGERVQLTLMGTKSDGGQTLSSFAIALGELQGLTAAQLGGSAEPVRFQWRRPAGTYEFQGRFRGGRGEGKVVFSPDEGFAGELARRGVGRPTPEQALSLAEAGVDLAFVDRMSRGAPQRPTVAELVGLRSHGVTPEYVRELAGLGYPSATMAELVAMRRQGITAEYVRELAALGYRGVPAGDLVRLRRQGVTPEFVRRSNTGAPRRRTVEELIQLRRRGS
jgi:hypothetical protein